VNVPPDHEQTIRTVIEDLPTATTVTEACRNIVAGLGRCARGRFSVLLRVHDRLRCVAATGSWQVYATVPPRTGVVNRAYTTGKTEVVANVESDPDYLPLRPDARAKICAPILDELGRPIGVLDLEWTEPVDLDRWREVAEEITEQLGDRIAALGGPPGESRAEMLLRYAAALTAATAEAELGAVIGQAARDISGLAAAVLVLDSGEGPTTHVPGQAPNDLECRIRTRLLAAGQPVLDRLRSRSHRFGASYTIGELGNPVSADHDRLIAAGVGTLIMVPVGPSDSGGLLLVADTRVLCPDPTTVNLIELLAAQSWLCLDRLRKVARLREQANSDPLTGLPHHRSFGERIATATPGRTALLAIDVDNFKSINDTYGHQFGDRVLVALSRALVHALRQGDELYRTGGDEFVAVVEVSRPEEALGIAERLAEAARQIGHPVSIGVAVQVAGEPSELTLRRADAALYRVKRGSRDGVCLAAG
jgi:diguanylate cyclase (GGDEF)-like protein